MGILKYSVMALVVLIVLVLVLIGVLSVTRGATVRTVITEGDREGPPEVSDPLFPRSIELFTGTHIEPGNTIEILLNGEGTYPPLWKDLAAAQKTITVQLYYSQPGAVADTMAKYLSERAQAGVRVLLLLDAFGSQNLSGEWAENLEKTGVEVQWLRPVRWYTLHKAGHRSHVRVVVVDGRVGYTGGFGLADYWLGDGRHDHQWRETNIRFEGPTVAALQAAFASGWAETTGELLTGDVFFPPIAFEEDGTVNAGLMHSLPTIGSTPAERFLALTIAGARKTLYISNAYFVPNADFCKLLINAAKRGVDVRVMTVSSKTDIKTTWYAGRGLYEKLLAEGVRIFEYQPAMMHAKTIVVDGLWVSVGSLNFDNRSIAFNNESQIVALDARMGQKMEQIFLEDIKYAEEIKLETFRQRSWKGKVLEWGAYQLRRVL
ncbi:MAG TPA: phospholipase D-like domain-containing protein [Gemmatimonadaceae bacterium]|nr:phospholipase D-like domain-containing protein [Gemmatimonadaceae bacterium]